MKKRLLVLIGCFALVILSTRIVFAQTPQPSPTSKPKSIIDILIEYIFGGGDPAESIKNVKEIDPDLQNEIFYQWGTPYPTNPATTYSGTLTDEDTAYVFEGEVDVSYNLADYGLDKYFDFALSNQLLGQLKGNEKAKWAAIRLLYYEKFLISKGERVKPYLTTAWLWFENGQRSFPDPYLQNCNDGAGSRSTNYTCPPTFTSKKTGKQVRSLLQVGGYQMQSQSSKIPSMFAKCHGNRALAEILLQTYENSKYASRNEWNYLTNTAGTEFESQYLYNGEFPADLSFSDFDTSQILGKGKDQALAVLVGKDPCLVVGLNQYAVSDGDLIRALKSPSCGYGYICEREKRLLASMVKALEVFDKEMTNELKKMKDDSGGYGPPEDASYGDDNFVHYCQCDPQWGGTGTAVCNGGCGPTTLAAIMSSLSGKKFTPTYVAGEMRNLGVWSANGMNTMMAALKSGWFEKQSPSFQPVLIDLVKGGRLDVEKAREYLKETPQRKCFIIGSMTTPNPWRYPPSWPNGIKHIFSITGITKDNKIIVHDSFLGCNPGSTTEKITHRVQDASYANHYAYPLCISK
jgi:hypothetical protein